MTVLLSASMALLNIFVVVQASSTFHNCTDDLGNKGHCTLVSECPSLAPLIDPSLIAIPEISTRLKNALTCPQVLVSIRQKNWNGGMHVVEQVCCPIIEDPVKHPAFNQFHKLQKQCGVILFPQIFGGEGVVEGQYPWSVGISFWRYEISPEPNREILPSDFLCGGSLISNNFVMTAAHCVIDPNGKDRIIWRLRIGTSTLINEEGTETGVNIICLKKCKTIVHPKYSPIVENDIALIKLPPNAEVSETPICLPFFNNPIKNKRMNRPTEKLLAIGFGKTKNGQFSNTLNEVKLPRTSRRRCENYLTWHGMKASQLSTFICAGGEKDQDTCNGDSGGPLMEVREGAFYAVGITSFSGKFCAKYGEISAYVSVYSYLPWILDHWWLNHVANSTV